MAAYRVWVDPEYRWDHVRVAGREFNKRAEVFVHETDAGFDEILESGLLVCEPVSRPDSGLDPAESADDADSAVVDDEGTGGGDGE